MAGMIGEVMDISRTHVQSNMDADGYNICRRVHVSEYTRVYVLAWSAGHPKRNDIPQEQ